MSNSEETVKDRLLAFLRSQNMSKAEFARRLGVSPAYVGAMRKSLPEDKVIRMAEIFPLLNRDWLLYGEGEMLLDPECAAENSEDDFSEYMVPLLPVEAFAGSLQYYSQGVGLRDCTMVASPVKGAQYAVHITGDSMEPEIHSGTLAAIVRINDKAFIPWGHPMVIDTENGVLIKVVLPSEKGEDYISAKSYNPRYPLIEIPKTTIYGIYRVVAYMRKVTTM